VITDSWPEDVEPAEVLDYQITAATLEHFAPDELIPCPPVTGARRSPPMQWCRRAVT
jgi:hypothetical protein